MVFGLLSVHFLFSRDKSHATVECTRKRRKNPTKMEIFKFDSVLCVYWTPKCVRSCACSYSFTLKYDEQPFLHLSSASNISCCQKTQWQVFNGHDNVETNDDDVVNEMNRNACVCVRIKLENTFFSRRRFFVKSVFICRCFRIENRFLRFEGNRQQKEEKKNDLLTKSVQMRAYVNTSEC